MDVALRRSLDAEDAIVLRSQAQTIAELLDRGAPAPRDVALRPERVVWRLVGTGGRVVMQSPGMSQVHGIEWPQGAGEPEEVAGNDGAEYDALVVPYGDEQLQLAIDRTHEGALLASYRRTLLLLWAASVLLAAAVGRWIATRGLAPLRLIAEEASAMRPHDLGRRLDGERFPTELQSLVATLNATFARLEEAFVRLGRLGSDLAHELRTPLQNLRAELEGLVLRPPSPDAQADALGSLLEELARVEAMVEQILFLARAEDPATVVARVPIEAGSLLRDTAAFFEALAEEAGVTLVVGAAGVAVVGDATLLRRALHNLVANAVRHTPTGGRVTLTATLQDAEAELCVEDTGEGMLEADLARVGERFHRVDGSRTRATGGSGLGLAIVKGIMALHGGRLEVRSRPGEGTQACLVLPRG